MADENNVMNIELQAEDKASPVINKTTDAVERLNDALKRFTSMRGTNDLREWAKSLQEVNAAFQNVQKQNISFNWSKEINVSSKDFEKAMDSYKRRISRSLSPVMGDKKTMNPNWVDSKETAKIADRTLSVYRKLEEPIQRIKEAEAERVKSAQQAAEAAKEERKALAKKTPESYSERVKSGEFGRLGSGSQSNSQADLFGKLASQIAQLNENNLALLGNIGKGKTDLESLIEKVRTYNEEMRKSADMRSRMLGTFRKAERSRDKETAKIGESGIKNLDTYQASQGRLRTVSANLTEAENILKRTSNSADRMVNKIAEYAGELSKIEISRDKLIKQQEELIDKEVKRKEAAEKTLEALKRQQKALEKQNKTENKEALQEQIDRAEKDVQEADYRIAHPEEIQEYRQISNQLTNDIDSKLKQLGKDVEFVMASYRGAIKAMKEVTDATEKGEKGFNKWSSAAEESAENAEEAFGNADERINHTSGLQKAFSNISQTLNLASGSMSNFASSLASIGTEGGAHPAMLAIAAVLKLVKFFVDQLIDGFKRLVRIVTKVAKLFGGAFKTAASKVVKVVSSLAKTLASFGANTVTKTLSKPFELIEKGFKSISSWIAMLKTRIKRRIVAEMFEDLTGTLGAMAEQRNEFNSSMSSMITSLRVLGAQIIAIAQPLLEILAPALELVSRLMTGIADKIAQFTARLNGQNEYFKASDGVYDFAEAMKSASGETEEATKSAKAYENTVMGFDQLNKLNGKNDNASAKSKNALTNPVNLKKALTQATALNKLADKIRKAFKDKDFKNAGKYVAEAVNDAFSWLDKVAGWEKNADKIKEFIGGVIDFINGFVEGLDPQVIGHAIGDVLNSVIESIKMLTDPETGINFELLGLRLGQILQNAVKTINWYDAGAAFMQTIQAFVRTAVGFLETPGLFEDIGTAFKNALRGAIESFSPEDWSDMIAGVVNGLSDFLVNAFDEEDFGKAGEKLGETLNESWQKIDKDKLSSGVANFIRSLSSFMMSTLKTTDFGTIFGEFVVTLADMLTKVFEDPTGEKDLFTSAEEKGSDFGNAVSEGFNNFVNKIKENKDKIVDSIVATIKAILSAIGTVLTTSDWATLLATFVNGFFDAISKIFEDPEKARQFGEDLSAQIKSFVDQLDAEKISQGINNFAESFNAFIDGLFNPDTMSSIEKKLTEIVEKIDWNGVMEAAWNSSVAGTIENAVNAWLTSIVNSIDKEVSSWNLELFGLKLDPVNAKRKNYYASANFGIGGFANGGDVGDGQLFIANEHGAEAITRGDGGRTIITNNQQMVQAVSSGVRSAVLEAIRMSSGSNNNGNGGDIVLYVDSEELARASLRGQRSLDKRLNPVIQFA